MQTNIQPTTTAQVVSKLLRSLPSGQVTKANLIKLVKEQPEYSKIHSIIWKGIVNEVWESSKPYFCKLYLENSPKSVIAVFFNEERERDNSLQAFSLNVSHFTTHPQYLLNKCRRIEPDHPAAANLVSYLRNGYAVNYHTETPIFV
jgi:hypothetical protein